MENSHRDEKAPTESGEQETGHFGQNLLRLQEITEDLENKAKVFEFSHQGNEAEWHNQSTALGILI